MDTERYVKCSWMGLDCYSNCQRHAVQWFIFDARLSSRCKLHRASVFVMPIYTNLQDALAALAMERL